MGGQIIDASIVSAPKQRNTDGEKAEIKRAAFRNPVRKSPPSSRRKIPRCALDGEVVEGQNVR
jgi:hypothetical protein